MIFLSVTFLFVLINVTRGGKSLLDVNYDFIFNYFTLYIYPNFLNLDNLIKDVINSNEYIPLLFSLGFISLPIFGKNLYFDSFPQDTVVYEAFNVWTGLAPSFIGGGIIEVVLMGFCISFFYTTFYRNIMIFRKACILSIFLFGILLNTFVMLHNSYFLLSTSPFVSFFLIWLLFKPKLYR